MKKTVFVLAAILIAASFQAPAQDINQFRKIVKELSSSKYQGRGYARDGILKAGRYIGRQYRKAGADEVIFQPFTIDINTFAGKMEMSVDGKELIPGDDFTLREYSPGAHGEYRLYFIDTLNYDSKRIFADIAKPENKGCFVVCDFWFTYKHSQDFKKLQSSECPNGGLIYTWNEPLKFYKAYGEKVVDKPIIWTLSDAVEGASSIKVDIDNKFLPQYESSNVIARVDGRRHDSCYVFIAHYDHLGNLGRDLYFPGANDNASGTAGLITFARHFAKNRPEFDMWFISVSGEEANLRGSTYFTEHPTFPLSNIKYMFDLDMIGDNNPVQYCEVSDAGMADFPIFEQINAQRGYFWKLHRGNLAANSDHYPFAVLGVPVIFFENEQGDAFKYYHTAHDDISTVRFETYEPLFKLIDEFIARHSASL